MRTSAIPTFKIMVGLFCLCCCTLAGQEISFVGKDHPLQEHQVRLQDFHELKAMGYTEREIYEDLGNASFLSKNYASALYWYTKLKEISKGGQLAKNYAKRYAYAQSQVNGTAQESLETEQNLTELILEDYQMTNVQYNRKETTSRDAFKPLSMEMLATGFAVQEPQKVNHGTGQLAYGAPVVLTADGNTAYFSEETWVKPSTGIFSKKMKVHKIYKAEKEEGEWRTIRELALCPNDFSAMHPAISQDGKRLFFASDMPGSFGDFDLYVAQIKANGAVGMAKNLGTKVNTDKNELYPKVMEGNTLVFASEGREGYGGLDIFMVEVAERSVGLAINLGGAINSAYDDFSIALKKDNGHGYVFTNRGGDKNTVEPVVFSLGAPADGTKDRDYKLLEAMHHTPMHYSSSLFQDE
jgi:hypothetical protein